MFIFMLFIDFLCWRNYYFYHIIVIIIRHIFITKSGHLIFLYFFWSDCLIIYFCIVWLKIIVKNIFFKIIIFFKKLNKSLKLMDLSNLFK